MDYQLDYSKTQVHFVTQTPEWEHLLDADKSVTAVLDLGTGGGRNSVHLHQLYPDALLVPLDLSAVRCAACRQVVKADITCGNSMELPFAAASFDLVISTQVIEHVPDDHVFVREIERVLKPNGLAIVSSVIKMRFGWYFYRNHRGEWVLDPTHEREYRSAAEFAALFQPLLAVDALSTDHFRFSPARFGYRLLVRAGLIGQPNPKFFGETRIGNLLAKLRIIVPGYRHVTVVVKKH